MENRPPIRKITVGNDITTALHFQLGSKSIKDYVVKHIKEKDNFIEIYIGKDDFMMEWKSFNKISVLHVEYLID